MTTIDITTCGASPDAADNTDAIQRALNDAKPGDAVLVPSGEFKVNPVVSLLVRSSTRLQIDGVLRALPGAIDKPNAMVNLNGVADVTINGTGAIYGERSAHAPGNRAGFCIAIVGSSNIIVSGLTLADAWADGIYVQDSKNVAVSCCHCINNARNGMSIISVEGMTVAGNVFENTNSESPMPQAGIDIEPDLATQSLLDISISKNRFVKNKGAGCYIAFASASNRARINVVNNQFDQHCRDGSGPPIGGRNTPLANFLYATCRWIPGYDYWAWPTEFALTVK